MTTTRSFAKLRSWRPTASILVLAAVAAVLAGYGLMVATLIELPPLGWLGFAIVAGVVLALTALAPLAFERTRVSPLRPADRTDSGRKLLVIADSHCDESALCKAILARLGNAVLVHVVVPVRVSRLHFVADDENKEQQEARQTMRHTVGLLNQRAPATGSVGTDKPLESMTDALGSFAATHVLLATPPEKDSYWLEQGLLARARRLTRLPVTNVVVPEKQPGTTSGNDAREPGHLVGRPSI
jgi:hypothetical protein